MASDEIVWQIINQQFCSYKLKYEMSNSSSRLRMLKFFSGQPKTRISAEMSTTVSSCRNY